MQEDGILLAFRDPKRHCCVIGCADGPNLKVARMATPYTNLISKTFLSPFLLCHFHVHILFSSMFPLACPFGHQKSFLALQ